MRPAFLAASILAAGCQETPESRNMTVNEVAEELANIRIAPGLWESTSEVVNVTAPNLPRELQNRMKGPSTTSRHCITAEQAARPDANFLATRQDNCTYRDFSMQGGRMQGTMVCNGGQLPGEATARMEGRYEPESYDMRMHMEMAAPADATMTIETRAVGRRVGECPTGGESEK